MGSGYTQAGGIESLESTLKLLISLKIRALCLCSVSGAPLAAGARHWTQCDKNGQPAQVSGTASLAALRTGHQGHEENVR